jgi:hypothetical protein
MNPFFVQIEQLRVTLAFASSVARKRTRPQ